MKFPKSFQILGNKILIKLVKNPKDEKGNSVDGYYSSIEKAIYIDSESSKDEKAHTFFHEYFHALSDCLGLGNCEFSHDLEEIIADNLGNQLSKTFNFTFKV